MGARHGNPASPYNLPASPPCWQRPRFAGDCRRRRCAPAAAFCCCRCLRRSAAGWPLQDGCASGIPSGAMWTSRCCPALLIRTRDEGPASVALFCRPGVPISGRPAARGTWRVDEWDVRGFQDCIAVRHWAFSSSSIVSRGGQLLLFAACSARLELASADVRCMPVTKAYATSLAHHSRSYQPILSPQSPGVRQSLAADADLDSLHKDSLRINSQSASKPAAGTETAAAHRGSSGSGSSDCGGHRRPPARNRQLTQSA
jgi:hypothetical protein